MDSGVSGRNFLVGDGDRRANHGIGIDGGVALPVLEDIYPAQENSLELRYTIFPSEKVELLAAQVYRQLRLGNLEAVAFQGPIGAVSIKELGFGHH
ncbi:MAG: hypothetical protein KC777_18200 [Cyanobacteria bacterium HKST-UBA02]|nr:hypothetical protein [Cyanobacteria bacterium HKST-UBA02]